MAVCKRPLSRSGENRPRTRFGSEAVWLLGVDFRRSASERQGIEADIAALINSAPLVNPGVIPRGDPQSGSSSGPVAGKVQVGGIKLPRGLQAVPVEHRQATTA